MIAKTRPKATVTAIIYRADGTVENLGVIATTENIQINKKFFDKLFKRKAKEVDK
ncbi:MAG: hypothetical protein WC477_05925 [Patescibacteria group bacterium]